MTADTPMREMMGAIISAGIFDDIPTSEIVDKLLDALMRPTDAMVNESIPRALRTNEQTPAIERSQMAPLHLFMQSFYLCAIRLAKEGK